MPFAPLPVMDFHQCIGQLFLLSGGDEDAPCRGERLPDKSKNQWQEFWTASGRIYPVIPNPRHHALVFDSRSASRSTMNPTTCEPRYPTVRWQIAAQTVQPLIQYSLCGRITAGWNRKLCWPWTIRQRGPLSPRTLLLVAIS